SLFRKGEGEEKGRRGRHLVRRLRAGTRPSLMEYTGAPVPPPREFSPDRRSTCSAAALPCRLITLGLADRAVVVTLLASSPDAFLQSQTKSASPGGPLRPPGGRFILSGPLSMSKKLYAGNLSYDVTDNDLRAMFEAHGTVTSAQVIMDRDT